MIEEHYKRVVLFYIFFVFIYSLLFTHNLSAEDWKEAKSDHFIVYFTQDRQFAQDVLDKAEVYYKRIATELGYPRYSEFWTWDKRVKIYIHPDHQSFIKATNQPEWSHGMADYRTKRIISFAWSKNFLESLLPHEMAHLIFRDFVGFKGEIPLWLDEGVAQWEEESKRHEMKKVVRQLYKEDTLLSLHDMMKLKLLEIKDMKKTYILSTLTKKGESASLILGTDNLVNIYYLQSVSLVGFLIEKYGSDSFAIFCRQLRDGKSLEEALRFAYPTHIQDLSELEMKWREY
ncbi:MAG: hypothetical protein HZC19_03905, partial [Candidatus Omnitrophica bacterium]|nr:hypothetical protein [Candidatus Omnitrophota bacterium]